MYDDNSLDIITEVINIGVGEAADALSKLVNTTGDHKDAGCPYHGRRGCS